MNFAEQLSGFAHEAKTHALSEPDIEYMKAMLLDWLGCTIAGASTAASRVLVETIPKSVQGSVGIGTRLTFDMYDAALVNGTAGHALDFDDSEFVGETHPSAVIFPALLAAAESQGSTLREVFHAAAVGYRILRPIGVALNPEHYGRGWHGTGTVGAFGAAAAVASLQGHDSNAMATALALTATAAAGQQVSFGTMAKPLNAGRAAREAVLAASLARQGFTAPLNAFEGRGGFFELLGHEAMDQGLIAHELAQASHPLNWVRLKEFPTCHCTHAAMIATRAIVARNLDKPVTAVDIKLSDYAHDMVSFRQPTTQEQAKFSQSFAVATIIQRHALGLADLVGDSLTNPVIRTIEDLVGCSIDTSLAEMEARVSVTFADGSVDEHAVNISRDGPAELPDSLLQKFRSNLAYAGTGVAAEPLTEYLDKDLDQPVSGLLTLTVPSETRVP